MCVLVHLFARVCLQVCAYVRGLVQYVYVHR